MTAIIAHRGASGYLPEHTLATKTLAHAMGADFLEQDVVASRDDELIVLHDIHLDRVTDVATVYPKRARADGRFYVRDFDLHELRSLRVHERVRADGRAVYQTRFPVAGSRFQIHTLGEELALIKGLNSTTGRQAGVYPEIKRPAWHRSEGVDMTPIMLSLLAEAGYRAHNDSIYLQCFDPAELRRIRHDMGSDLKLVQLIANNGSDESDADYEAMQTTTGLRQLAATVDAIGPSIAHICTCSQADGRIQSTGLVARAHKAGLKVHPYTFRADELPLGFATFAQLVRYVVVELSVDGLFTDFPDRAAQALA